MTNVARKAPPAYQVHLQQRSALAERVSEIKGELEGISSKIFEKERQALDARNRAESRAQRLRADGLDEKAPFADELKEARTAAARAQRELADLRGRQAVLTRELHATSGKLNDPSSVSMGRDEVLAFKGDRERARDEVVRIQKLLDDQRATAVAAETALSPSSDLLARREGLAADVALGVVGAQEALREVERKIGGHESVAAEARKTIERGRPAIAGLERRLADAQAAFARLDSEVPEVQALFLDRVAESEAAEYVQHLEAARQSYCRLLALTRALKETTGRNVARVSTVRDGFVVFQFSAIAEHRDDRSGTKLLFKPLGVDAAVEDEWTKVLATLRELGLAE